MLAGPIEVRGEGMGSRMPTAVSRFCPHSAALTRLLSGHRFLFVFMLQGILAFCGEGCHGWFTDALSKLPETVDPTKEEFRSLLLSYNPNTSYDSSVTRTSTRTRSRGSECAIG